MIENIAYGALVIQFKLSLKAAYFQDMIVMAKLMDVKTVSSPS